MKNKNKSSYSALQWKIYLRIALFAVIALVIVGILSALANNRFANWFVSFIYERFNLPYHVARDIYQRYIRNNIDYLIYAAFGIFFIILARFLLMQFSKYFNQISGGLDALVENKPGAIKLSPEMAFMENKLITIQETLIKREQEIIASEQRKSDMIMYLAHDIKTPLTSVLGYLSLLDEAADMPVEQKEKYIHIALEKANRLERLVDEFFEISRYNLDLQKENIDLNYMLIQMAEEFYPLLFSKGKKIELIIDENTVIYGDPDKLARVFNNILKNAAAYSVDNSIIKVTAKIIENIVSIAFVNEGIIPKDKLANIFEKFYRLDSARSSDTGGTGLGLAIAKEIVLQHGGQIYAESDEIFTTFMVELPQ